MSIFFGGLLGGYLTKNELYILHKNFEYLTPILLVFIFSSIVRLFIWFIYLGSENRTI